MALNSTAATLLLHISFLSFCVPLSGSIYTDIGCLKSIKASIVDDPRNHLHSWNFDNFTSGFVCNFVGVDCWHFDENRVLNIRLTDVGLKGEFPRAIQNCTTITGLNLSGNEFSGKIPSDIGKLLPFVSVLDLSRNNLSGEIPPGIANCSYLNVLELNNNRLSGPIPAAIGLLDRLRSFSVANNLLYGSIPRLFNRNIKADSYANNPGLCGNPLDPCLAPPKKSPKLFISGFAVGYAAAIVSVLIIAIWVCKPKLPDDKKKMIEKKSEMGRRRSSTKGRSTDIKISTLERLFTRMSFKELCEATSGFSKDNVIGSGNTGTMYKATLPNGWFLAVKRFHNSQHLKRQFASELMTLGRLRHNNLVPLLGFGIEKKEKLLVYQYLSNGTLYDLLHHPETDARAIDWPLRVKIIIGIARGLAWLHYCCNVRVVHLNISSKSILLDDRFEPKISNFGEGIFMNPNCTTESPRDFIVNEEFWELGFVKKDVHSFGILLLELITGKNPHPSEVTNSFDGILNEWNTSVSSTSFGFYDAIDKCLVGSGDVGDIFQVLRIAYNCVHPFPEQRPTMLEVYKTLSFIGERYGIVNDNDIFSQTEIAMVSKKDE